MDVYKKTALALFALTIIGLGVPLAAAQSSGILYQYSAGIAALETDNIAIKITGNNQAPHFHWWDPSNEDTLDYHVMFVKMFEANDTNADGFYDTNNDTIVGVPFMLPTTGWNFTGFVIVEEEGITTQVHFNFTTTESEPGIEVCVHMYTDNPGQFKFDVIVDSWAWESDNSLLVLMFTVTESVHGEPGPGLTPVEPHKVATQFKFGDAFFEYAETATAAENSLEVKASFGEGNAIFLAIENFGDDTLVYDPILGVLPSEPGTIVDPMTIGIIGGVAVIAILAIVLVRKK